MTAALASLERLLALSEAMRSAATAEEWETLASREAERRLLADSLPANLLENLQPLQQKRARLLIEACQRCDESIHPRVEARLRELRVVLRETPAVQRGQ